MLVLVYKKLNSLNSYKIAKIRFFKEFDNTVLLNILETPEMNLILRNNLREILKK